MLLTDFMRNVCHTCCCILMDMASICCPASSSCRVSLSALASATAAEGLLGTVPSADAPSRTWEPLRAMGVRPGPELFFRASSSSSSASFCCAVSRCLQRQHFVCKSCHAYVAALAVLRMVCCCLLGSAMLCCAMLSQPLCLLCCGDSCCAVPPCAAPCCAKAMLCLMCCGAICRAASSCAASCCAKLQVCCLKLLQCYAMACCLQNGLTIDHVPVQPSGRTFSPDRGT